MPTVHLLDYVAGNVRSLVNALEKVGYDVEWITSPDQVPQAEKLILPGVGRFGHCVGQLAAAGYLPAVRQHIDAGKPFLGICVGLQALFRGSAEDPACQGLGLIDGALGRFDDSKKSVPHIGWNDARMPSALAEALEEEAKAAAAAADAAAAPPSRVTRSQPAAAPTYPFYDLRPASKYYYVHSYQHPYTPGELEAAGWAVATATYGDEEFVGALARGNVVATQFHPEKSGVAGLRFLRAFLDGSGRAALGTAQAAALPPPPLAVGGLTRRVIACLDVRANDAGDLVVTKGDQYDVRDQADAARGVRNLGKPVALAERYYAQGADEVTFLNITSFRDCPLADAPMLEVLRQTARTVFVPLTVGGGIRDTVDADGTPVSALDIAALYFKSGADKVSIGSDAVLAAEAYYAAGRTLAGTTAIEQIAAAYGSQAVVVSVDPKRVWVNAPSPSSTRHRTVPAAPDEPGPDPGKRHYWYACTIKGGRETRDLDVVQLAQAVEAMGAGELLLNSIDRDGTNRGYDTALISMVKGAVRIPVIASSGAGNPGHFDHVFAHTSVDAALGAGIFHRGEYTVAQVKDYLASHGHVVRLPEEDL